MRERIMNGLRMAGDKLKAMDIAYAEALTPTVATSTVGSIGAMGRGMPIHEIRNSLPRMGEEGLRDVLPSERNKLDLAYESLLYASNIGSRYALPAGAGVGVISGIGGLLNQPVDQTNPPVGY